MLLAYYGRITPFWSGCFSHSNGSCTSRGNVAHHASGDNICLCKSRIGSASSTPMFARSYWAVNTTKGKMDLLLKHKGLQLVAWCSVEEFHALMCKSGEDFPQIQNSAIYFDQLRHVHCFNLGGPFGIKQFCAIINPPQAGILAVGSPEKRVIPGSGVGEFKFSSYMSVTLSCEHRVIDEAGGSSDGPKRRRTYIFREREEAEQRLIDDYFGDDEYEPKYPEEKFRRSTDEKSLKFKRVQEAARKDIERAFGVLQDEEFEVNFRDMFVNPAPNIVRDWVERCDLHVRKTKELRDRKTPHRSFDKTCMGASM
ncbi:ALP1-like protein isoform X1 [Tanacetum coccineum]